jgi:hypothetical protein
VTDGSCTETPTCTTSLRTVQGKQGRCGCGGGGGVGGTGAWGGGASVGLYAYGATTTVVLEGSTVRASKGGNGGTGGLGGESAPGASGTKGSNTSYDTFFCKPDFHCPPASPDCDPPTSCFDNGGGTVVGTTGGAGGKGGKGGKGGSGAGGPAFAVVTAGGAQIDASAATLEPGIGGLGGSGAPSGGAGPLAAF